MQRGFLVIGRPQLVAVAMLLCFAVECGWVIYHRPLTRSEQDQVWAGRQQLAYGGSPRIFAYTPLSNVAAALPMDIDANRVDTQNPTPDAVLHEVRRLRWMLRLPFLAAGLLLGVSIWYVSRRLYGNHGGYISLALYCTSPLYVLAGASINDFLLASWGAFGVVFTGIAISHNLYAPWRKWRYRTLLFAVAIALAVASHPATVVLLPLAFLFLLYLAPGRRLAALAVMAVSCAVALLLVHASYGFHVRAMMDGLDLRDWLALKPAVARATLFSRTPLLLRFPPATELLAISAVATYFIWRRTRYFGNTGPLVTLGLLLYLSLTLTGSAYFSAWALPFLFVFIGGIWADLLETRRWQLALGAVLIAIGENLLFTVRMLRGWHP